MASPFERFVASQMSYYEAFAQLPQRSRLRSALGVALTIAAALILVYLIYRPYLYTSGPGGQRVLLTFVVLFISLTTVCVFSMVVPAVVEWKTTVLVLSALFGAVTGTLWIVAANAESVPLFGRLFETPSPDIINLGIILALAGFSAGSMLVTASLSEIQQERSRMQTELRLAQDIQERLLPATGTQTGAYAAYGAARLASEVGGDFFDIVEREDPAAPLVVAVGDVAGHNVAAGLMMATAKGALRGSLDAWEPATLPASPADGNLQAVENTRTERVRSVLETMNRTVYAHAGRRHFVSSQVGLFDFAEERLLLGNAGHVPLLCWRHASGSVEAIAPRSAALGLLPTGSASIEAVPFAPGDIFLFYTDGLLEARSETDGTEFGLERARELLAAEAPGAAPETLCARFFEALEAQTGGETPSDDVTLLAVHVAK